MERLTGYVDHIIFRNEENGYSVFVLENEDGEVTCVGSIPLLHEGELVDVEGQFVLHPTYGMQWKVEKLTVKTPEDEESIARYLGSGAIKGVGEKLASRIVQTFGEETFRIIEEEPERLAEIKGISPRIARSIGTQVEEKSAMRDAMMYMERFGITPRLAAKIYERYGQELFAVIQNNPYRLAEDIEGVGFKTADTIAAEAGIPVDSAFRIRSGVVYALSQSVGEGHVYLPEDELYANACDLLGVESFDLDEILLELSIDRLVVVSQTDSGRNVYLSRFYFMEINTAKMLTDLNIREEVDETALRRMISRAEREQEQELDEQQRQAVISAFACGILLLTGGPGTGKTTTVNTLIRCARRQKMSFLLAAPTGRAAKRMSEATGFEAKTIHRLLEVGAGAEGEGKAQRQRVECKRNARRDRASV